QRLDQAQDGAYVVQRGRAQVIEGVFDHHGAHAVVGEDLEQDAAVQCVGHQVGARHAALDRQRGVAQVEGCVFVQVAARQQRIGVRAGQFGVYAAVCVQHAV